MTNIKKIMISIMLLSIIMILAIATGCKEGEPEIRNNGEEFFKDEIVISAFWPPMLDFVNDTQFKYMQDAHIDLMEYGSDPIFNDPDSVEKMLKLCEKYDIYVTIYDNDSKGWLEASDEEIQKIAKKWMKYEGVVGFFLRDEPQNANPYGRVVQAIREVFPNAICQMNMLPAGAFKDPVGHAEDWVNSAGLGNLSYLSFDQYPFGLAEGSRPQMFYNLDLVRNVGLKYGVNTACYIQSISNTTGFRDPTVSETRYHTSAALAYGFKNLKYFTWMTPVERDEVFTNAIINPDGTKNERYDGIVDINTKIKAVSKILGRCDALEIYHSDAQDMLTRPVPKDYFITPDCKTDVIFSLMGDRYDETNYLMLVNKDFSRTRDMTFNLNGIELTDVTSGSETGEKIKDNLTVSIEAGGFKLFKIYGENIRPEYEDDNEKNIARGKPVYSSSSVGDRGWYACKAVDGVKYSSSSSQGFMLDVLCQEIEGIEQFFMIDLKRDVEFNRIDIYPTGKDDKFGKNYPLSYDIYISSDLKNFTKIVSYERDKPLETVPSFTFDTVKSRYVKIVFTQPDLDLELDGIAFSEIEIYKD